MSQLVVTISGSAVPWGCGERTWKWREKVRDAARSLGKPHIDGQHVLSEIRIVFWGARSDLDNLAKPILDTLFNIKRFQGKDKSLTGVWFDVDDDHVRKLSLERRSGEAEPRTEVTVSWK